MSLVALVRCEDYTLADDAVAQSLDLLGGASRFVRPGDHILLKPNLLKAAPPEDAVTTHPEIIRAVIRHLRTAVTASDVHYAVGDSPAWGSFSGAARAAGYSAVCETENATLLPFTKGKKISNTNGSVYTHLHLAREAVRADGLINLPKLKTHCQLYMTGAVKNLFGCVAGKRKAWWHFKAGSYADYFPLMLVETARLLKPRLSIMDAVLAMEGQGPGSGLPKKTGLILASEDPVALDRIACEVAGLDPARLRTLDAARILGWGETDLSKIKIAGLPLEEARLPVPLTEPKMIPVGFSLPRVVKSTLKQQWKLRVEEPLGKLPSP